MALPVVLLFCRESRCIVSRNGRIAADAGVVLGAALQLTDGMKRSLEAIILAECMDRLTDDLMAGDAVG